MFCLWCVHTVQYMDVVGICKYHSMNIYICINLSDHDVSLSLYMYIYISQKYFIHHSLFQLQLFFGLHFLLQELWPYLDFFFI